MQRSHPPQRSRRQLPGGAAAAAPGRRFALRSPLRLWGYLLLAACVSALVALAVSRLAPEDRGDPSHLALAVFPTAVFVLVFGTLIPRNEAEVRPEGLAITILGWKRRVRWSDVARVWTGWGEVEIELRPRRNPIARLRPGRRHLHFRPRRLEAFLEAVAAAHPAGWQAIVRLP